MMSKLKGVGSREFNYELPLMFAVVILPTMDNLWSFKCIFSHIAHQIEIFYQVHFEALVDYTTMPVYIVK